MSTNRKIARAFSILTAASIVGHALSLVKEMLGANYFGVTKAMDSFYAALTIPNLVNSVLLSPFVIIFVPILVKYRTKDPEAANRIISTVSNVIFAGLAAAAAAAFLFPGALISVFSPGLAAGVAADAEKMLKILSFAILFTGAVNILTGIINAYEHFLWPAVSGVFITLCTILLMVLFADKWGVYVIAWGLLAGTVLQFLFLLPGAQRHGFRYRAVLDTEHPEIRKSLNLTFVFLIITVLGGLNTAVNRFMASWLPEGSIAGLAYADKLVQVPLIIFSGAIATSIYPFLSAQAAENKIEEIRNTVSLSIRMSGFIFIPLAGALMVLSAPVIQMLFQRGAFDAAATDLTSKIVVFYSFQLFSTASVAVMQRLLFAFQDFKSILRITAVSLVLTVLLNVLLIKLMTPPACGVALATSLGSFISAVLYFYTLKKRISNLHGLAILKSFARIAAISAVSSLAVFLAYGQLGSTYAPAAHKAVTITAAGGAGLAVFLLIAALFKLEEFRKVYQLFRSKFRSWQGGPA